MLLPLDPDASARALRARLGCAIVITDSFGRAWRKGQCEVAIGCAGPRPRPRLPRRARRRRPRAARDRHRDRRRGRRRGGPRAGQDLARARRAHPRPRALRHLRRRPGRRRARAAVGRRPVPLGDAGDQLRLGGGEGATPRLPNASGGSSSGTSSTARSSALAPSPSVPRSSARAPARPAPPGSSGRALRPRRARVEPVPRLLDLPAMRQRPGARGPSAAAPSRRPETSARTPRAAAPRRGRGGRRARRAPSRAGSG